MDGNLRENGRHRQEHFRSSHSQWLIPPHLMKDHHGLSMKFLSIISDRDTAYHERDLALAEKKAALAERDIALLQRDAAILDRNSAIMERDNAISAYKYQENTMNGNDGPYPSGSVPPRETKQANRQLDMHHSAHDMPESPYNNSTEMPISDAYPLAVSTSEVVKPRKGRRPKNIQASPVTKPLPKQSKKIKKEKGNARDTDEDQNKQIIAVKEEEWKDQDLSLNLVTYDKSSMPIPVCSCTGILQSCYKWGSGGWQSACCTTSISMYPLPVMPNKRHARIGGRKMSGSVFNKLLNRLASDGYDLSTPIDLKDHWSRHGTNRYMTIK